jgi:Mu transposase, C-terminal.
MHVSQNVHLENNGLIEKRHDSQHHLEATLTISQYTQMVINFVITHNQQYLETYRLTKEMVENDIRSIPAELWQYGIEKYGSPRYISNKMQFYYDLMTPKAAKITRKGISFKGLYYIPENDELMGHQMFTAGKKGESLKIKIDLRDISKIYYTRNNEVFVARLNEHVSGNSEFGGLTMKQWDDYRKKMGKMKMEGKVYNDALLSYRYAINELIVKDAGKSTVSKQRDMKEARELEKQRIALDNKIAKRITDDEEGSYVDENPKSIDVPQSNSLDSEKTELSEYDKKIEEIKKKKSYELTQEEASMLMKYAIDHFYDE